MLHSLSGLHNVRCHCKLIWFIVGPKPHKSEPADNFAIQLELFAMSKLQIGLSLVGCDAAPMNNYDVSKVPTIFKVPKQRAPWRWRQYLPTKRPKPSIQRRSFTAQKKGKFDCTGVKNRKIETSMQFVQSSIQNIPDWCRHLYSSCGNAKHR
jgi:hypothetical protein